MDYDNIPSELKQQRRWVSYFLYDKPGNDKKGKAPINPNTLRGAMSNNPATWGTYDQAVNAIGKAASASVDQKDQDGKTTKVMVNGTISGIGFELGDGYFGVDLDGVLNDQGQLDFDAEDIVNTLDSYTEISPSGTGVHILCCGAIPTGRRRRGVVEMYGESDGTAKGRFFTVTGKVYGPPRPLAKRTEAAAIVHAKYIQQDDIKPTESVGLSKQGDGVTIPQHGVGDDEITRRLNAVLKDKYWTPFQKLWRGDYSSYSTDGAPDHSKGDLALCIDLARLTDGDWVQMDKLFRQSGMYRSKWDEMRGNEKYSDKTLSAALLTYARDPVPFAVGQDLSQISVKSEPTAKAEPNALRPGLQMPTADNPNPDNMLAYMRERFQGDVTRNANQKKIKTGFAYLDKVMGGLTPGFHILGAVSGWGKTTFCLQMADQVAMQGQHVLYFALEQGKLELVAKSLSRITTDIDKVHAVESKNIRMGVHTSTVQQARQQYAEQIAPYMHIVNCGFNTTAMQINDYVGAYVAINKVTPIVIVDYLQAVQSESNGIRESVEESLGQLKTMQVQHDLVLIVLSILNRSNYLYPIDFTSFKESGKIEATADVAWGLQLRCLTTEKLFEKDDKSNVTEKRERVKAAKLETPRKMDLVSIKTRYESEYTCGFDYYAKFDCFMDDAEYNKGQNDTKTLQSAQNDWASPMPTTYKKV